jgi:hypothetical protein
MIEYILSCLSISVHIDWKGITNVMGTDISLTAVFAPQGGFPCDRTRREHGCLVPRKDISHVAQC